MEKHIKNIEELVAGGPRPHYLVGSAIYETKGEEHILKATAYFPADEAHPSILDRANARIPHVNVLDCLGAGWNAIHALLSMNGYEGALDDEIDIHGKPSGLIPPNQNIDITARLYNIVEDRTYSSKADFEFIFSRNGRPIHTYTGSGRGFRKINS